eukprot:107658-Chlamydomonas_euryale.AAC.4
MGSACAIAASTGESQRGGKHEAVSVKCVRVWGINGEGPRRGAQCGAARTQARVCHWVAGVDS